MDAEKRAAIKYLVDQKKRQLCDNGYMDCDPESLTVRAADADLMGFPDVANAIRKFRDEVVNKLLAEGWSFERIEIAAMRHFTKLGY